MILVVGLGNIGKQYQNTYHNAGFLFIDECVKENFLLEKKFEAYIARSGSTMFAKPTTYMNRSGDAIKKITTYFNIPPENVVIVHDDSDILLGEYKVQNGRGSGGHHGINSIFQQLGTNQLTRIRIGVRPLRFQGLKASQFVLHRISQEDQAILQATFAKIRQTHPEVIGLEQIHHTHKPE